MLGFISAGTIRREALIKLLRLNGMAQTMIRASQLMIGESYYWMGMSLLPVRLKL